ncbi:unannotated protein [freshwater metagenome]|uniref:Unannotated protein n=1 Tax=freshwater metagenome TaxID=449393 RepID=A0A6J6V357_9ZZZZ
MFNFLRSGRGTPAGHSTVTLLGNALDVESTMPLPSEPKFPASAHTAYAAKYALPPLRLRSMPQPLRNIAGLIVVSNSAKRTISDASTPHTSAARSIVHSSAAAKNALAPTVCLSTNAWSTRLLCCIQRASAKPSTTSVPGRTAKCTSARAAVLVARGSITTICAPFFFALVRIGTRWVLLALGLPPHTTTSFECSMSCGSHESISPNTRSHASDFVLAQIVCSISGQPSRSNR